MALKIYNTLSRTKEEFVPLDSAGKKVGLYACGPTVYDFAHIGNFRTFVFVDLVRRYLAFKGFEVEHVMNITDVEDKIIRNVRETGLSRAEFTGKYEDAFLKDLDTLNCEKPGRIPRATEHIAGIISLIEKLVERGIAYRADDGSVYFSIAKYIEAGHTYGKLQKLNMEEMRPGERVSDDEYEKESLADFALWKARVEEDGEVFWESPWGEGRPGWHIECSAMSMDLLGPSFDLHLGGEDLKFPHHEDEIAQSEGACLQSDGAPFVKYWMHGAHLFVNGQKMSKKLGNFFTLRDLTEKGYTGRAIRFLLLSAHYRDTFNFTEDALSGSALEALQRLDNCLFQMREIAGETEGAAADLETLKQFEAALDDDLNVAKAWGAVFDWVRDLNRRAAEGSLSAEQASAALTTWARIDSVFGVGEKATDGPPAEIVALAEERATARKNKDFAKSDKLRDELAAQGWIVEDKPEGYRLKRG